MDPKDETTVGAQAPIGTVTSEPLPPITPAQPTAPVEVPKPAATAAPAPAPEKLDRDTERLYEIVSNDLTPEPQREWAKKELARRGKPLAQTAATTPAPTAPAPPAAPQATVAPTAPVTPADPEEFVAPAGAPAWWRTAEAGARTHGVSPRVLYKMGGAESNWNPNARARTSSATGIWQFIESTWEGLKKSYPELNLGDRTDPESQARAAPVLLRDYNRIIMKATGKTSLSDGEQYLGWFLGGTGAGKVLNAAPDTPIENLVPFKDRAANPGILSPDSKGRQAVRTAADALKWAEGKMGSKVVGKWTGTGEVGPSQRQDMGFGDFQPNSIKSYSQIQKELEEQANKDIGFVRSVGESLKIDTVVGQMWMDRNRELVVDPDYSFSAVKKDIDALVSTRRSEIPQSLEKHHFDYLYEARSKADLDYRWERMKEELEVEAQLATAGVKGMAGRFIGTMLDPVGIAAGLGVGKALQAGKLGYTLYNGSRAGRAAMFGVEGALGNVATDALIAAQSSNYSPEQFLYSGAAGFLLGGGIGAATYKGASPLAREFADRMGATASRITTELTTPAGGSMSAGAALNPRVTPMSMIAEDFSDPKFLEGFRDRNVVETAFPQLQIGAAKQTASANPLEAAFTSASVVDAVGPAKAGAVVNVPLEVDMLRLQRTFDTRINRAVDEAWRAHVEANDVNRYVAAFNGEKRRFREEISEAVWDTSGSRVTNPHVLKAAGELRKQFDEWLDIMKGDHRNLDGTIRKPLPGSENLEKNPHYMPHIIDHLSFDAHLKRLGSMNLQDFVRKAFRNNNPDMDPKLATKWADSWFNRVRKITSGAEVGIDSAFSGRDKFKLREYLKEDGGWADDEIEALMRHMHEPKDKEGSVRHLKKRASYDENFEMTYSVNGRQETIRMADLLERDAMKLALAYNRTMAGHVAMSRFRLENPKFDPDNPDVEPQYLVDGITSESEWKSFLQKVAEVGHALGHSKEQIQASQTRMQWIYDSISGRPDKFTQDHPRIAQTLRIVRDLNFLRVMNQVGFAQIAELGMITSEFGYRTAFQAMPTWRELVRDGKTGKYTPVMEDLVWMTSAGTDDLRALGYMLNDDWGAPIHETGTKMDKVEQLVRSGTRITSHISGMAAINTYLQRFAVKAAMFNFIKAAREGKSALNMNRLRALGLDDATVDKILKELQPKSKGGKASYVLDDVSGKKLETLGLKDWDPETRAAFGNALFMWGRKVIQENDLGQMNWFTGSIVGKILLQFRNFMLASWAKNTLHNANMMRQGDYGTTLNMIVATSFFGGLAYYAQSHLQTVAMDDATRKKHLEQRLGKNNEKLYAAAFSRASYSSIFPMFLDNALMLPLGMDPVFDTRVTGTPSQGIVSNPTLALYDNVVNALRGSSRAAFTDDRMDKRTMRSIAGVMPFGNSIPMIALMNGVTQGMPDRNERN